MKKSYFAMPVSVSEHYKKREISAYCAVVLAYLCSLRNAASNPFGELFYRKSELQRCSNQPEIHRYVLRNYSENCIETRETVASLWEKRDYEREIWQWQKYRKLPPT